MSCAAADRQLWSDVPRRASGRTSCRHAREGAARGDAAAAVARTAPGSGSLRSMTPLCSWTVTAQDCFARLDARSRAALGVAACAARSAAQTTENCAAAVLSAGDVKLLALSWTVVFGDPMTPGFLQKKDVQYWCWGTHVLL